MSGRLDYYYNSMNEMIDENQWLQNPWLELRIKETARIILRILEEEEWIDVDNEMYQTAHKILYNK